MLSRVLSKSLVRRRFAARLRAWLKASALSQEGTSAGRALVGALALADGTKAR